MHPTYSLFEGPAPLDRTLLHQLKELDREHFPMSWAPESWETFLASKEEPFFLVKVVVEGELQGFLLAHFSVADSFSHLLKIVVHPLLRKKGVGRKLIHEALHFLKAQGIATFFLEVEERNAAAILLYQKCGFKIIHQKKQFYQNGETALIMTLSICI